MGLISLSVTLYRRRYLNMTRYKSHVITEKIKTTIVIKILNSEQKD